MSIDWFKGKFTEKSYISWENLVGFRLRFSLSRQPIEDEIPPVPSLPSTGPVRLFHHVLLVVALGAAIRTLLHQASGLDENDEAQPPIWRYPE